MEKTFSSRDGSYLHIAVRRKRDSIEFTGDRSGSDCVHTLESWVFPAFIEAIGQPAGTDIIIAIESALESDPNAVWTAIHDIHTTTDFSWQSMDDIDEMMELFESLRG